MKNANIRSAIVLCGGKSRRMGEDKGSLIINQKPMILHILETLNNQIDEAILVLNNKERIAKYRNIIQSYFNNDFNIEFSYNLIFLEDEIKGQGPLSGIMTGLDNISSDYALVLPCDSPFVNDNFINLMFDSLNNKLSINYKKNKLDNSHSDDSDIIEAIIPYHPNYDDSNENISFKPEVFGSDEDFSFKPEVFGSDEDFSFKPEVFGSDEDFSFKPEDVNSNKDFIFNENNNFFLNNENEFMKNLLLNNCEPLHSIYKKDNSKKIKKLLNSNINDVKSFLKSINSYFVFNYNKNNFKNINTKKDI